MTAAGERADGGAGWSLAVAGSLLWLVDLLLLSSPVVRALSAVVVTAMLAWLLARRWASSRIPRTWQGPTSLGQGLLVLGMALSQLGLEFGTRGAPGPARFGLFALAMALLVGSAVAGAGAEG